MSIPGSSSPLFFQTAAGGGAVLTGPGAKSARFSQDDNAYLSRTPSSSGNRRTWTLSLWVKRSELYSNVGYQIIFAGGSGTKLEFDSVDQIRLYNDSGSTEANGYRFRDTNGWAHLQVTCDTTQSTASERVKIYLNGVDITKKTGSFPAQNAELQINRNDIHYIGRDGNGNSYFSGYITAMYLLDGTAVGPTTFGEYDSNGVWQLKEPTGLSFGTNGFHLFDFANETGIGNDSSGNDNDFQVFNMQSGTTGTATAKLLCCASTSSNSATVVNAGGSLSVQGSVNAGSYTINSNSTGANDFNGENGYIKINSNQSAYSPAKPGSPWTAEAFVNVDSFSNYPCVLEWNQSGTSKYFVPLQLTATTFYCNSSGMGANFSLNTAHSFSTGTWYHLVAVYDGTRISTYVDGTRIATTTYSGDLSVMSGYDIYIGAFGFNGSVQDYFNGKISNLRWTLAANYDPNATSITVPSVPLSSTITGATLGGSEIIDVLFDSPINGSTDSDTCAGGEISSNYATLNPLMYRSTTAISNGNLDIAPGGNDSYGTVDANIGISSGKFYWEVTINTATTTPFIGIRRPTDNKQTFVGNTANSYAMGGGNKWNNGNNVSYGGSTNAGDVIGVALDMDNGTLKFYKNGSDQGTAYTGLSGLYMPALSEGGGGHVTYTVNFGQRAFTHAGPSGYKTLCTSNLFGTPAIANGKDAFEAKVWTGNGSTQTISGFSMRPDLIWMKNRSFGTSHELYDRVRGVEKVIKSDTEDAEATESNGLTSFGSTSFNIGNNNPINRNNDSIVGWVWNAGSGIYAQSNSNGSVTSSVRANQAAGFSIVTWTSSNETNHTWGHGLGTAPQMIILRRRDAGTPWLVGHEDMGWTKKMNLNNNTAGVANSAYWQDTAPTSTVVYSGTSSRIGGNNIAYCFTSIPGYSMVSSYKGTGNPDGMVNNFVYTGFRPAFLLIKDYTVGGAGRNWVVHDSTRDPYNDTDAKLYWNLSDSEVDGSNNQIRLLSNGFQLGTSQTATNNSSTRYIFYAVAEHPFSANGGLAR